ncbi:hypothetical protein RchiOBHm_Chr2g0101321 [Rosa chinensis]|uniref:Uncharacterized protein n=1 Tax=Rosa chinensis TaxID=74649 RepID=A0A2P6RME6_ROSCH|nr:hypothetical protein RchiOBHm_Chr2g0101321 [Rosa chinensis]
MGLFRSEKASMVAWVSDVVGQIGFPWRRLFQSGLLLRVSHLETLGFGWGRSSGLMGLGPVGLTCHTFSPLGLGLEWTVGR